MKKNYIEISNTERHQCQTYNTPYFALEVIKLTSNNNKKVIRIRKLELGHLNLRMLFAKSVLRGTRCNANF